MRGGEGEEEDVCFGIPLAAAFAKVESDSDRRNSDHRVFLCFM